MRRPVHTRKDQKIFSRTASKGKKINIKPTTYRGGVCL